MGDLSVSQVHELLEKNVSECIDRWDDYAKDLPQVEVPAKESFVNGMYVREIMIPAGTLLTGRVHKYPYVDIMLSGKLDVITPDGVKRLEGYHNMAGVPGRKRAGYAYEDTHWVTVHRTDHKNQETILDHLTFFSMREYNDYRRAIDHASFSAIVKAAGFTEAEVRVISENTADMIEMPDDYAYNVCIGQSEIEGDGLFAMQDYKPGEHICPARIDGMRTAAGRYSNHSAHANGKMLLLDNGDMALIAIEPIAKGSEITTNYGDTLKSQGVDICRQ